MNRSGATIWLNTPIPLLIQRLGKEKKERPLIRELSEEQLKSFIIKKFADRKIYYEQADVIIDDDQVRLEDITEKVFHA
jgi:shikimate kinase